MTKIDKSNAKSDLKDDSNSNALLVKYMQDNQPKGSRLSKLDPVKAIVLKLNSDGYSHEQISECIKIIGIVAHSTTIGRFIRKCRNPNQYSPVHGEVKSENSEVDKNKEVTRSVLSNNHANLDAISRPEEKVASFVPYKGNIGDKK